MTIQILVMGPGHVWRDEMVRCLQDQDMVVRTIDSASGWARAIATQEPDVILLSDQFARGLMQSSSVDMLTLLQQAAPRVPVIMLGTRADSMERIICLECGADDYMDMPGHPRELLSRIRNILRYRPRATRSLIDGDGDCAFGDFVFNRSRQRLTRDGVTVALQESAMSLLGKLAENPMKVLSRQALIEMLNGVNGGVRREVAVDTVRGVTGGGTLPRGGVSCERSLDVVVCRLRRVIETDPSRPKFLQTVRGFGYVFNPSGGGEALPTTSLSPKHQAQQRHQAHQVQQPQQPHHPLPLHPSHQDAMQKTVRRAVSSADTARTINPWFSAISFPKQYPASEDLVSRSPA